MRARGCALSSFRSRAPPPLTISISLTISIFLYLSSRFASSHQGAGALAELDAGDGSAAAVVGRQLVPGLDREHLRGQRGTGRTATKYDIRAEHGAERYKLPALYPLRRLLSVSMSADECGWTARQTRKAFSTERDKVDRYRPPAPNPFLQPIESTRRGRNAPTRPLHTHTHSTLNHTRHAPHYNR